ncbi:MAG: hypothetical protein KF774_20320 [Planctomyces sp.]|nr:hypothetical protein [Planctomyces sp.]
MTPAARSSHGRFSVRVSALLVAGLSAAVAAPARGQDMRVYTVVKNIGSGQPGGTILAESLTLFHAGKVYDYMENVGEVVIFEPQQNRFTILGGDYAATTVTFEEVQQFLSASRKEAERYLENAPQDSASRRRAAGLEFQLRPRFHESLRPDGLKLTGDCVAYDLKTETPPTDAPWSAYLDYADWAARLNYILHPQSLFPEPRLEVNSALRTHQRLPVSVTLVGRFDQDVHIRAEHNFSWRLQPIDRQFIDNWERRRESASLRWVSVHEYQQHLLAKSSSSRSRSTGPAPRK